INDIHTFYGESYVLKGLSLKVDAALVVTMIGRNGMGKTTTMRSIIGFTPPRRGKIYFRGEDITGLQSFKINRKGLSLVPQGRRIFPSLTVRENLILAARDTKREQDWDIKKVISFFPLLKDRLGNRGNQLSGGEQQLVALARALISNPDLILMDEPSEGLAPLVIRHIGDIIQQLKEEGFSILLAEQNLPLALKVSDYIYVINQGMMVFEGPPEQLAKNKEIERQYLAV
ncbi:MAG: ABC transporter ATP-binding protein, partial [Thermodesulfobacteriota bacterium]|nr:ABC transporter ATP-binding protein [Thermodesulfobacteriota bacterium]